MPVTLELTDEQLDKIAEAVSLRLQAKERAVKPAPRNEHERPMKYVYVRYMQESIFAWYWPQTETLTIYSGPAIIEEATSLDKTLSVNEATQLVIKLLNPSIEPSRNGWLFWRLEENNEFLGTIRTKPTKRRRK